MYARKLFGTATAIAFVMAGSVLAETIAVATVKYGDMIRTQDLTDDITARTGDKVEWVTYAEKVFRQRGTLDVATKNRSVAVFLTGLATTDVRNIATETSEAQREHRFAEGWNYV